EAQGTRYVPTWGLVYYLTPPQGILAVLEDIPRAIIYGITVMVICIVLYKMWIQTFVMRHPDVLQELIAAGIQIVEWEEDLKNTATTRGIIIGGIISLADFLGGLGSGAGIVIAVSFMWYFYENYVKEKPTGRLNRTELRQGILVTVLGLGIVGIIGYVIKIIWIPLSQIFIVY
ncbi:MAG: hypothetical protein ACFFBD_25330, partial [Candidatus Hodarchaeota archaeon]